VVLDGVFNHTGRGFFPFHDVLENGANSPYFDWFTVYGTPVNAYDLSRPPGYEAWWRLHALPKLNTANPVVREYLMGVGEHWIRRGADGWRLDVPEEIKTPGFWEEFRARVRAVNPEAYLVGEIWHPAPEWTAGGTRFDGVMNYVLTEAILRFAAGARIDPQVVAPVSLTLQPGLDAAGYGEAIDRLLATYPEASHRANLNLLGSHDTPRVLSMVGEDRDSVVLSALLMFTFIGAPCVYYGDEVGMRGHHDPGARAAFPWEWPDNWDREILEAFRSLAALRREHPALRRGIYRHLASAGSLYAFSRELADEVVVVAVNAGTEESAVTGEAPGAESRTALRAWGRGEAVLEGGALTLRVPGRSGAVWTLW
jgi:glycosidase